MKILLVQTGFLGDTILSTPVIHAMKSVYPHADLWMMTTPQSAELVERDPRLSGVVAYDKKGGASGLSGMLDMRRRLKTIGFDRAYSLHRSYRTALLLWAAGIPRRIGCGEVRLSFAYHEIRPQDSRQHAVLRNLSILRPEAQVDAMDRRMRLFPEELQALRPEVLRKLRPAERPLVAMFPGSAWATKMWHWEGYRSVAQFLIEHGFHVVLLGGTSDQKVCKNIADGLPVTDLSGKIRISEAMVVVGSARLMVCNDSMALHMASALQVPTVALFCATSPAFGYGPWMNRAVVVEKEDLACKPCRRHGSLRCPTGTEACMRDIPLNEVLDAIRKLLDLT